MSVGDRARLKFLQEHLATDRGARSSDAQDTLAIQIIESMLRRSEAVTKARSACTRALIAELDRCPELKTGQLRVAIRDYLGPPARTGCSWAIDFELARLRRDLLVESGELEKTLLRRLVAIERDYFAEICDGMQFDDLRGTSSQSQAATQPCEVDKAALADFLNRELSLSRKLEVFDVRTLAGGYSKQTLLVGVKGGGELGSELVIRQDGTAVHSAGSVVSEYALLRKLHHLGVNVPRPLACDAEGGVLGTPFIVLEKREGGALGNMIKLPRKDAEACRSVAAELARIHRAPLMEFEKAWSHPPSAKNSDWVREMLDKDIALWRSLGIEAPAFDTAFTWLEANVGINDEAPRSFVHGDYGLQNILVRAGKVEAVLDWEFATAGNPAYDLGYFFDQAEALSSWSEFLTAYRDSGGQDLSEDQLHYHVLLAATRFGVMSWQILTSFDSADGAVTSGADLLADPLFEVFSFRVARALERVL